MLVKVSGRDRSRDISGLVCIMSMEYSSLLTESTNPNIYPRELLEPITAFCIVIFSSSSS